MVFWWDSVGLVPVCRPQYSRGSQELNRDCSLQLVEVEDGAGTACHGASDDGQAFCGEFGAGLGLEGRSQAVGLGQARLHFGEFVSVHGLAESEGLGVPPRQMLVERAIE